MGRQEMECFRRKCANPEIRFVLSVIHAFLPHWLVPTQSRITGYSYAYPSCLDRYRLPKAEANEILIERGITELSGQLERLEDGYLRNRKYLAGDRLTIADSYVATILIQVEWVGFKFKLWPRVDAWLKRVRAQEYWSEVHAAHCQLVEEIESAPFEY